MAGTINITRDCVDSASFLKIMKSYHHFRVRFLTRNKKPFEYVYFRITKKELKQYIQCNQVNVEYEIMHYSKVGDEDIVYIIKTNSNI